MSRCTLGVGCDEVGVCYAVAHGRPEMCGAQGIETAKPPRREAGSARKGESAVAESDAPTPSSPNTPNTGRIA